ncbi:gamma-tubulin complex component 2 homolog [Scaptodrosophila lebanonensis]|uniref:Gamma-tubulin complex component n=1 Tax=Drosophila lebanonensis TaxID=7225 RepID=A0A6J2TXG1_DROLE|nr:gamma-tubulin complex component 2 homolog [Scaptodrosophila lebanonensis]
MESEIEKKFAGKMRFQLSKGELETQIRSVHDRIEEFTAISDATIKDKETTDISESGSPTGLSPLKDLLQSPPMAEEPQRDSWIFERVDGYYIPTEDVRKIPVERQEKLLMRDLIYAFSGVPASHIKPDLPFDKIAELSARDIGKVRFKIDDAFCCAFRALANELLPLISYYISVQSFVEETSMTSNCGRVRQALAAAFQEYLSSYYELQAQLETELHDGRLNLQKLVQQLRPSLIIMEAYAKVSTTVRDGRLNSAQVLSLLDELYKDHKEAEDLCKAMEQLIANVSQSYMKLVQIWTQKGVIYDPQREFFIEDTERVSAMSSTLLSPEQCCYEYWFKRYRLHLERLPSFLLPHADIILNAGKYLNVLRQCNVQLKLMQSPLTYAPNDSQHLDLLQTSYELSAQKLLQVLVKEQNIMLHLRNVFGYFLLQPEQFTDAFISHADEQLQRNVDRILPEKLQGLLGDVLQPSTDPFKDLLHCELMMCDLLTQLAKHMKRAHCCDGQDDAQSAGDTEPATVMTSEGETEPDTLNLFGYEAFTLRYEAKWPVSLVLHAEVISKLQLLHRLLFFLRYIQRQLASLWHLQTEDVIQTTCSCMLRQRMLSSVVGLEQYMTKDVIEPHWETLVRAVEKAPHIDDLQTQFQLFLDQCLLLCLISEDSTFVRSIFTLGHVCLNYCRYVETPPGRTDYDAFESGVGEYEEEFSSFVLSIMELIDELAQKSDSLGVSCKQLLRRLESVHGQLQSEEQSTTSDL